MTIEDCTADDAAAWIAAQQWKIYRCAPNWWRSAFGRLYNRNALFGLRRVANAWVPVYGASEGDHSIVGIVVWARPMHALPESDQFAQASEFVRKYNALIRGDMAVLVHNGRRSLPAPRYDLALHFSTIPMGVTAT